MNARKRIVVALCLAIIWALLSTIIFVFHAQGALSGMVLAPPVGRDKDERSAKREMKNMLKRKWRNTWKRFGFYSFAQLVRNIVKNTSPNDVVSPPFGYPWWGDNVTSAKPLSNDAIASLHETWERIVVAYNNSNFTTPEQRPVAYIFYKGRLYGSTAQLKDLHESNPDYYAARLQTFHEMMLSALAIGRAYAPKAAQLSLLFSNHPLPILLDDRDFRDCLNKPYPRMTYAMVAPEKRKQKQDKCIALAIPGYDPWLTLSRHFLNPHHWDEQFRLWKIEYPWRTKFPEAVWRGSSTGPINLPWQQMPRARLVQNSLERPDLFDAAFTAIVQRNDINVSQTRMADGILFEDFMEYRAVLDIDGNSWSSRFEKTLCQNSVVIKVEPQYSGYSYGELEPWEHYVPIDANMTNITNIVAYVVSDEHADEMRAIVRRANLWCREKMTATRMALDVLWILVSYAELMVDGHDNDWSKQWLEHIEKKEHGLNRIEVD